MQARRTWVEADIPDDFARAAALALESVELARKSKRPVEADAIETIGRELNQLPLAVFAHGSPVRSLAVLGDGRLASGGEDGKVKIWSLNDRGESVVLSHGGPVRSLSVLADGRLASGGEDGNISLWPKDGLGEPTVLAHGGQVLSLPVLADGRLASGGEDGNIRLWPKDVADEPVVLPHGSPVESLAMLPDGRLASGDVAGTIKLWLVDEQETDRRPLSSRRPQCNQGRVGSLHQLRHSVAPELSRPPLELADHRPVTHACDRGRPAAALTRSSPLFTMRQRAEAGSAE
jgi:WD40 repeat protein